MIQVGPSHQAQNHYNNTLNTESSQDSPKNLNQNVFANLQNAQFIDFLHAQQQYPSFISQQIVYNYSVYEPKYTKYTREDWKNINKCSDTSQISYTELECNLRDGVPDDLRPRLWFWLTGMQKLERKFKGQYDKLKNEPSIFDEQINKDVPRTMSKHHYFSDVVAPSGNSSENNSPQISKNQSQESRHSSLKSNGSPSSNVGPTKSKGQQQLFNVLRAYSNLDKEVGYVQGMHLLAAHILINLRPEKYTNFSRSFGNKCSESQIEEKAFLIFTHIMIEKNWRQTYIPGLIRHRVLLEAAKKQFHPDILSHFHDIKLDILSTFQNFYLSLFLSDVSLEFGRRFLDLFLHKGEQLIDQIIVRLLDIYHDEILKQNDGFECSIYIMQHMFKHAYKNHKNNLSILLPLSTSHTKRM